MNARTEPTNDELLAMAYVDGELDTEQRTALEARLPREPELARRVAHYRELELLARRMAAPEPADHEWERLESGPLHSVGARLAWVLLTLGALGLVGYGIFGLVASPVAAFPKTCLLCLIGGIALLAALTIHARLRLLPFDPYRKVKR